MLMQCCHQCLALCSSLLFHISLSVFSTGLRLSINSIKDQIYCNWFYVLKKVNTIYWFKMCFIMCNNLSCDNNDVIFPPRQQTAIFTWGVSQSKPLAQLIYPWGALWHSTHDPLDCDIMESELTLPTHNLSVRSSVVEPALTQTTILSRGSTGPQTCDLCFHHPCNILMQAIWAHGQWTNAPVPQATVKNLNDHGL